MGKKSTTNVPPADPAIGQAAMEQAALGRDYLAFAREQFGADSRRQDELAALTRQVTTQQLDASRQAQQWATEDRARYDSVFKSLQDQAIQRAQTWDSPERQAVVASEARADVLNNASDQRFIRNRQMGAMGIDPTSGRYAGVERAGELQTGLAAAGAQNMARNQVRKEAIGLQADAINMGSGLGMNPGQSLGLGVQAGSAALAGQSNLGQQARAGVGVMQSGYQTAMGGLQSQGNILANQQNYNLNAWNASNQARMQNQQSLWGGVGQIAGLAGMAIFSSKEVKEDKRPVDGALEAVRSMPVEEWSYKEGVADEGRHIGPYAEDFQKATGQGDGRSIDVISAIGLNMKATQELAERVDELATVMPTARRRRRAAKKESA